MRFHKLEESINPEVTFSGLIENDRIGAANRTLRNLRSAQKFFVGQMTDSGVPHSVPNSPSHLPYPTIAVEMASGENTAIVIAEELHGTIRCDCFLSVGEDCGGWWYFGSGLFRDPWSGFDQRPVSLDPPIEALLNNIVGFFSCFLAILNCVNVRTEQVDAPAALNKKRIKSGKMPVYSYKVLVLRPSAAQRQDQGGTHESPRIHLRRGHIKHRRSGDFWWQPHVVGDRKRGIVMKDYRADELVH